MLHRRHLVLGLGGLAAGCAASASPSPVPQAPVPAVAPGLAPAGAATGPAAATPAPEPFDQASTASFERFVEGVRAEARRSGVSDGILRRAFSNVAPNRRVIELDRRQAEGALSWEEYRDRIMVSPTRVANGRRNFNDNADLLRRIEGRYRVSPRVIVAIWGVETNFGGNTGGFGTIDALTTLAWEGRRASYFRNELMAALRILEGQHIPPERMRGSWAGAMGQPQFMPSNFERLAVDFDGDGHRDIWENRGDALASIANYFNRNGWREGEPWGRAVLPPGDPSGLDTERRQPLREFARLGYRDADGSALPTAGAAGEIESQVVMPNRGSGQVFLGHHNLRVIRRYNSPVNYGLAVGLLSDSFRA